MATITITTSRTYNAEDYFYQHVGSENAQQSIDEISDCLDDFLDFVGAKRGARAEWYYGCQCRGLYADTPNIDEYHLPEADSYPEKLWCDYDFKNAWAPHAKRISILRDAYAKCRQMSDKYWQRDWDKFTIWDARLSYARRAFYEEVDSALADVCNAAERLMGAECDYWYSHEAFEEWILENQDMLDED